MALTLGAVDLLVQRLLPRCGKGTVLSLARQAILVPRDNLKDYLSKKGFAHTAVRPYTSRELFLDFGFASYADVDFTSDEGVTFVHDMNQPVPDDMGQYDLVFEAGTIEHIFDARQVFENIVKLTKPGGTVFHLSPLTWFNHGFYNFSLTIFHDVYRVNGFADFEYIVVGFPKDWARNPNVTLQDIDFTASQIELQSPDHFLLICFMATKKEEGPFRVPIQAAYDPALRLNTPLKRHT